MNTFGSTGTQFALCDPLEPTLNRTRFRRGDIPLLHKVNHFYCPSGKLPFKGWLLLPRYEYDQISPYSTSLQLKIGDTTRSDNVSTIKHLSIVQARCVTRGLESDRNALYLIEITDRRGVLHNQWFQFPTNPNTMYNIRAPAYPQTDRGGTFYTNSMNGGTTWTWQTMIQDLWTQMSALLGIWPGFPQGFAPDGTPEGYYFPGVPAWPALCNVLDHLGLKIACNLTSDVPYTLVVENAEDSSLTSLQSQYQGSLEDDLEWQDVGAGRLPGTVKVMFRRRNDVYGSEETVRRDSFQWVTDSVYSVTINAPGDFSTAPGTHHIWSDFTVRYDHNGVIYPADATFAATLARQRVDQYFAHTRPDAFMTKTYAGALPFTTGSKVEGVCWYRNRQDSYSGWRTQIVYGPDPPWSNIWD